jgi:hypothetical protein
MILVMGTGYLGGFLSGVNGPGSKTKRPPLPPAAGKDEDFDSLYVRLEV